MNKSYYFHGNLPVAFVFSAPGACEELASRPIAGVTGENLSSALNYLNRMLPEIFTSVDRYEYRITNAHPKVLAKSLGDKYSEAQNFQIRKPENIDRVLEKLNGCNVVILCGLKAQLLANYVIKVGRTVVCASHTSNQALSKKFNLPEIAKIVESSERRQLRTKLWAQHILSSFQGT